MDTLLRCDGGSLCIPPTCMIDRNDGGNLVVMPPREVWDRSELGVDELAKWSMLIAAASRAMLDCLPQLAGGVINYWDAGNWALNDAAPPIGRKSGRQYKRVHLHLIGRSSAATDPDWQWGEAPVFPRYCDAEKWAMGKSPLNRSECLAVTRQTKQLLVEKYGVAEDSIIIATGNKAAGKLNEIR